MTQSFRALLNLLERVDSEEEAVAALEEFLILAQDRPFTCQERDKAFCASSHLVQRGILSEAHPLMKFLDYRLQPAYLPGVSELRLPSANSLESSISLRHSPHLSSHKFVRNGNSCNTKKSYQAEPTHASDDFPPPLVTNPPKQGYVPHDFLFRRVPPETKMLCTIRRLPSNSKAVSPTYRLFLERVLVSNDAVRMVRQEDLAKDAITMHPRAVMSEECEGARFPGAPSLEADRPHCLCTVRAQKAGDGSNSAGKAPCSPLPRVTTETRSFCVLAVLAPPAAASTLPLASDPRGDTGEEEGALPLGWLHRPCRGVWTAVSTSSADANILTPHLAVHISEARSRLLFLSVVLRTDGQDTPNPFRQHHVFQVPLAHLQSPCASSLANENSMPTGWNAWGMRHIKSKVGSNPSALPSRAPNVDPPTPASSSSETPISLPSSSSSSPLAGPPVVPSSPRVLTLHSQLPAWDPARGLHALDFEMGEQRVPLPSRKNLVVVEATASSLQDYAAGLTEVRASGHRAEGGSGARRRGRTAVRTWVGLSHLGGGGGLRRGERSGVDDAAASEWGTLERPRFACQLGKLSEDAYSLDFRAPFSPFQALAVAVAALEEY